MVNNLFNIIGDAAATMQKDELQEAKDILRTKQGLATMSMAEDFESNASGFLINLSADYTGDGSLVKDVEQYLSDQQASVLNNIEDEELRNNTQAAFIRISSGIKQKAQGVMLQKEQQLIKRDIDLLQGKKVAKIYLSGGDFESLDNEVAKIQGETAFVPAGTREAVSTHLVSSVAKATVDAQLDSLNLRLVKGEINPNDFITQVDILKQKIIGQPDIYKLSEGDVSTYMNKLNKAAARNSAIGTQQYVAAIKSDLKAQETLISKGAMSPLDPQFVTNREKLKPFISAEEAKKMDVAYEGLVTSNQASIAAYQGDIETLTQLNQAANSAYEASKSDDPELQLIRLATKNTLQAITQRTATQLRGENGGQGNLLVNNPEIKALMNAGRYNDAVNAMAAVSSEYVDVHNFRPLDDGTFNAIKQELNATGTDFDRYKNTVRKWQQAYSGPVAAFGGRDGWDIIVSNIHDRLGRKARNSKEGDPFDLDEKKLLLMAYVDNPNYNQMHNYLIAPTNSFDALSAGDKSRVLDPINKAIGRYTAAYASRNDIVSTSIPSEVLHPLVTQIAKGHYELSQSKSGKNSAKFALGNLLEQHQKIVSSHTGDIVIDKNINEEVERVLRSREATNAMIKELGVQDIINLKFPEVYTLDGRPDITVTKAALLNNSELQERSPGSYSLYLRFQDLSYSVLGKDGKPLIFSDEQLMPFARSVNEGDIMRNEGYFPTGAKTSLPFLQGVRGVGGVR